MRYACLVFSMSSTDFLRVVAGIAAGRNPGIRFRSAVPDYAAAGEKIVLAALARVYIPWGHTRPERSTFTAQAEVFVDLHIESHTRLQYTRGVPVVFGLAPELPLKWPNPPPKLTHGETACSGKRFKRAAGVMK